MGTNKTQNLLSVLSRAVDVFGEDKTAQILNDATVNKPKVEFINFVISMVCERLKFHPNSITSKSRNKKRMIVVKLICYYAYVFGNKYPIFIVNKNSTRKTNICYTEIADIIQRDEKIVRCYCNEIINQRDKNNFYYDDFNYFDEVINTYIHQHTLTI